MPTFLQILDLPAGTFEDKGWLPVKSISQSVTTEVGKFEASGKARHVPYSEAGDVEVKRTFDRGSLFLQSTCSSGELLKGVNLVFSRADEKEFYLKIEMKNVYISEFGVDISDGEDPEETVKFNYESVVWKFRPKNKAGKLLDWMQAGWDRFERKPVTG
ncbi:MAG TPA: type VI secretion system tube protein Hcp [Pirellulales bacterium]|jgi:type VI secretion system Hcp family effector|nr:type VI secretion system tube protein Hcp [Pirellulales bacterium]